MDYENSYAASTGEQLKVMILDKLNVNGTQRNKNDLSVSKLLHRRAAYSICESWFLINQDVYHDLFVCSW